MQKRIADDGALLFTDLRPIRIYQLDATGPTSLDRDQKNETRGLCVHVFDKSGQYLGPIPVPRRPTNVASAGPDKRTLYITAREGLYRLQTLTRGPERLGK